MYSVVVILDWQRKEIVETLEGLTKFLNQNHKKHELILVGNALDSDYLEQLSFENFNDVDVKFVQFTRRVTDGMGLSGALPHCSGDAILTCAPYPQLEDTAILALIEAFENGADLVVPWRKFRVDPGINQAQSRLFNRFVQRTTGTNYQDLSCPYRVLSKKILSDFHLYGDLYRYLPIMAQREGYRVVEVPCAHKTEEGKKGTYSFREYVGRIINFLTFHFDLFSSRKPLRYFGKRALFFLTPGALLLFVLVAGATLEVFKVGNSPWLILALVLLLLGSMIWSVGLLGEVIAFAQGRHRKDYRVDKVVE